MRSKGQFQDKLSERFWNIFYQEMGTPLFGIQMLFSFGDSALKEHNTMCPPTKVREGNAFSRVCMSVHRESLHETLALTLSVQGLSLHHSLVLQTCSDLFNLSLAAQDPTPTHVQTF